jgi:hypothetical protein
MGLFSDLKEVCCCLSLIPVIAGWLVAETCMLCLHIPRSSDLKKEDVQPPKVSPRVPAPTSGSDAKNRQLQSRLFRLPGELRNKIFEDVAGARKDVHMVMRNGKGKLSSIKCKQPRNNAGDFVGHSDWNHGWSSCRGNLPMLLDTPVNYQGPHGMRVMGLLCSCRAA